MPIDPIIVTGVPRSGISLVAAALEVCGAWNGAKRTGSVDGRGGENERLRERVIKPVLRGLGADASGYRNFPKTGAIDRAIAEAVMDSIRDRVDRIIQEQGYVGDVPWLYADSRAVLLWRILVGAFPASQWIVARRADEEIIRSCDRTKWMKRTGDGRAAWDRMILAYRAQIKALREAHGVVHCVNPGRMIHGDHEEMRGVAEKVGVSWNDTAIGDLFSPIAWSSAGWGGD